MPSASHLGHPRAERLGERRLQPRGRSVELEGDGLRIGRIAAADRTCPDGTEQEQRLLKSMEEVEQYRIRGSHLEVLRRATRSHDSRR
jgi:hypothetical protein